MHSLLTALYLDADKAGIGKRTRTRTVEPVEVRAGRPRARRWF